jgi:glucosamine--fructose-6-phosphate aminotransferase (isomerizing)
MGVEQTLFYKEAGEAAAVAERQLAQLPALLGRLGKMLRATDPPVVITCARGSSDHAATFAKYLVETRALTPVASHAPSVSSVYSTAWKKLDGALFLAISQSGRSPDIIVSARSAREAGALVVAIVNDEGSPLAELADVAIPMLAGPERSIAASKSYIASLLAIVGLVAAWTEDDALDAALRGSPEILRLAWTLDWSPALAGLSAAGNLFVLGRGLTLAIAQEGALKLKETCGLHAEAYSAAEVRHGPMALVGPDFPVLMLVPNDEGREGFGPLARDFVGRGAQVFMVGDDGGDPVTLPIVPNLHPALAPIAIIQSFYRFAAALSLARGLDPDRPPSLKKVTETR